MFAIYLYLLSLSPIKSPNWKLEWSSFFSYSLISAASCSSSNSLMLKEILSSASSTLSTLTLTDWSTSSTSSGDPICLLAICDIWTNPSTPGSTSTKAPKFTRRLTVPSSTSPVDILSSILVHGPGITFLRDKEILSLSRSTERTSTSIVSPSDTTSEAFSTCSCASCEI